MSRRCRAASILLVVAGLLSAQVPELRATRRPPRPESPPPPEMRAARRRGDPPSPIWSGVTSNTLDAAGNDGLDGTARGKVPSISKAYQRSARLFQSAGRIAGPISNAVSLAPAFERGYYYHDALGATHYSVHTLLGNLAGAKGAAGGLVFIASMSTPPGMLVGGLITLGTALSGSFAYNLIGKPLINLAFNPLRLGALRGLIDEAGTALGNGDLVRAEGCARAAWNGFDAIDDPELAASSTTERLRAYVRDDLIPRIRRGREAVGLAEAALTVAQRALAAQPRVPADLSGALGRIDRALQERAALAAAHQSNHLHRLDQARAALQAALVKPAELRRDTAWYYRGRWTVAGLQVQVRGTSAAKAAELRRGLSSMYEEMVFEITLNGNRVDLYGLDRGRRDGPPIALFLEHEAPVGEALAAAGYQRQVGGTQRFRLIPQADGTIRLILGMELDGVQTTLECGLRRMW